MELLKELIKYLTCCVFYGKGIDKLDTVIEEASHTGLKIWRCFYGSVYDLAKI